MYEFCFSGGGLLLETRKSHYYVESFQISHIMSDLNLTIF